jgi:hypothetical protein
MANWSPPFTPEQRELLRRLIDHERRARIRWQADRRCVGCGVEIEDRESGEFRYLAGCRTCADRRAKHRLRERQTLSKWP